MWYVDRLLAPSNRKDVVLPFRSVSRGGTILRSSRPLSRAARLGVVAWLLALLAGCQALSSLSTAARSRNRPSSPPTTRSPSTTSRATTGSPNWPRAQHPRILATYGGEYSDPKLERMVAKVVGSLTTVSGNPDPDLSHHHPQFAQRQRLRAARRLSLRDARPAGARQRFGRARGRDRPRDGPCHRQSRPAAPAEGSRGGARRPRS